MGAQGPPRNTAQKQSEGESVAQFRFSTPSSNHCLSPMWTFSNLLHVAYSSSVAWDPAGMLLLLTLSKLWRSILSIHEPIITMAAALPRSGSSFNRWIKLLQTQWRHLKSRDKCWNSSWWSITQLMASSVKNSIFLLWYLPALVSS